MGLKLPKTANLSDSKVRRDKLSLNRINRCYRFLSKKICSFLYQNLMSRARNFWIFRPKALNWDKLKGYFVSTRQNIPIVTANSPSTKP